MKAWRPLFTIIIPALLCGGAAHAAEIANSVEFSPVFNASSGLEMQVQNYSKLPRTLAGVDVYLGGSQDKAACHVAVPGLTLAPAARGTVLVADARTVNACLLKGAPARATARLAGLDNLPTRMGEASTAAVPVERAVRIVPHFPAGASGGDPPREMRFRLAN